MSFGCFIIGIVATGVMAYLLGGLDAEHDFKSEAVEKGFGEFVITDPKTGETKFKWKESK